MDAFHALGLDVAGRSSVGFVEGLGPVLGLREIMRRNGHGSVDVLKVDIEGGEFCLIEKLFNGPDEVLGDTGLGCRRRPLVGQIAMELHGWENNAPFDYFENDDEVGNLGSGGDGIDGNGSVPLPESADEKQANGRRATVALRKRSRVSRVHGVLNVNIVRAVRRLWAVLERAGYRLVSVDPVVFPGSHNAEVLFVHRDWTPWGWGWGDDDGGGGIDDEGTNCTGKGSGEGSGGRAAWLQRLDAWELSWARKGDVRAAAAARQAKGSRFDVLSGEAPDAADDDVVVAAAARGLRLQPCKALASGRAGWGFERRGE